MMNILNESAEQVFQQLINEVGPKARTSLTRIKDACDEIEALGGLMNYSRVAAVATKRFNGPRAQTIQNSKQLKAYIAVRMHEYQTRKRTRPRASKFTESTGASGSPYPAEGLDAKTKLFIDCMTQDNRRLETENRRLTRMLEEATERRPISLAEALGRGPTSTLGLDVKLAADMTEMPEGLMETLRTLFSCEISHFEVQRREEAIRLAYELDGVVHTLLSPSQWQAAKDWLKGLSGANDT